jgi:hypothetical protein
MQVRAQLIDMGDVVLGSSFSEEKEAKRLLKIFRKAN